MTVHYVDNTKFFDLLIKYINEREEMKSKNVSPPKIPNEIGRIIIQIANKLSLRHNFYGYTFRDEMINDGIISAIEAVDKFKPEKSNNPFAYFTQVIFWAFVRRIEIEKKVRKIKDKLINDMSIETFNVNGYDEFEMNRDDIHLSEG